MSYEVFVIADAEEDLFEIYNYIVTHDSIAIEDYIDFLKGDERKIEILCNRFAGQFLVPNSDFDI